MRLAPLLLTCLLTVPAFAQSSPKVATASDVKLGAVASVSPHATDAAMEALRQGGNAIDAAVACMLTLGVVDGHNSGIGGGCFMVIRLADGTMVALDGREMAPAKATRDMYLVDGKADPTLSQTGPLAVGVPGALATYDLALERFGKRTLADAITPAARIAANGHHIDANYAAKIRRTVGDIRKFDATKKLLLKPDGSPLLEGDLLVQPDLAATYRAIAREGTDSFYKGDFARRVDAWMSANGGILTAADLANYVVKERKPIRTTYRGYEIVGMPPPSSGGVHVAQILSMVERFDLSSMTEADRITTIANAMNLAFADRAHWLGDPDFANVPSGLVEVEYLKSLSQKLASDKAIVVESHGTPTSADRAFFEREAQKHTTHVSVADAAGNVVSVTATVNTTFGSKVIVPGTGVFLNNEMDDFSAQPGVPNAFKLVGAEANAVAPGKRPLSSMSPTIVLKEGKPIIVVGAAGGPKIITQVVGVLTNLIDAKLSPEAAMAAPRFHHQWKPGTLWIEKSASQSTRDALRSRGFTLDEADPSGATNLVVFDGSGVTAVTEPRLEGKAAAE
jgi:gamma-glutamyltranspeptidase / glutathione hydrolase